MFTSLWLSLLLLPKKGEVAHFSSAQLDVAFCPEDEGDVVVEDDVVVVVEVLVPAEVVLFDQLGALNLAGAALIVRHVRLVAQLHEHFLSANRSTCGSFTYYY